MKSRVNRAKWLLLTLTSLAWPQEYVVTTNQKIPGPGGMALDSAGNLYVADKTSRVHKFSPDGFDTVVAGTGIPGYSGDGGPATNAQLSNPATAGIGTAMGLAVDSQGNLYIADSTNNRVRKVSLDGTITTVAGTGVWGYSGDSGPATLAQINHPTSVAVDARGNLYIADAYNGRVRKIDSRGIITTVAGNGVNGSYLTFPFGLAIDSAGNIFIADAGKHEVYKLSTNGITTRVAGNFWRWFGGDGGPATNACLSAPVGVAVDSGGNLYIADRGNHNVRKVSPAGIITTLAGDVTLDYTGVDRGPTWVVADAAGRIYVSEPDADAVRVLRPAASLPSVKDCRNAASNLQGPVAAGEIVVITGEGLGPIQLVSAVSDGDGHYDTELSGTRVQFDGTPAPIIYAWAEQVAAVVPYSVSDGSAEVTVTYRNQTSAPLTVWVHPSAPGVFTLDSTGKGQAAAVNQDGSINGPSRPAKVGDFISLYATGEGQTSPSGSDGRVAGISPPRPNLPVIVIIGGQEVVPTYAAGAPGQIAGLMQINARIPSGLLPTDQASVLVKLGADWPTFSQSGVTIAVRP